MYCNWHFVSLAASHTQTLVLEDSRASGGRNDHNITQKGSQEELGTEAQSWAELRSNLGSAGC